MAWVAAFVSMLAACTPIGPRTLTRDRFDFGTGVAESWKQQTLLAIVKLRYLDLPVFLDVGQIVSGYTLETGVDLSSQLAPVNRGDTFGGLGGHSTFTDRPTITYTPLTGDRFLPRLISPSDEVVVDGEDGDARRDLEDQRAERLRDPELGFENASDGCRC